MKDIVLERYPLTDAEKRTIRTWEYDGEYAVYNLPSYEKMRERQAGVLNPAQGKNFSAYYHGDSIVGFVNLLEEETEVFLGIGVDQAVCGQGYGQSVLKAAYQRSKRLYPDKPLYLEVRTWNQRAVHCYQKAGLLIDGKPFEQETGIGKGSFYRTVKA